MRTAFRFGAAAVALALAATGTAAQQRTTLDLRATVVRTHTPSFTIGATTTDTAMRYLGIELRISRRF